MYAGVFRLQIFRQVSRTRSLLDNEQVAHGDITGLAAGAQGVELLHHVHGAAHGAEVDEEAAPEGHTAVTGRKTHVGSC